MKEICDLADIEGSISDTLKEHAEVWISRTTAMFFWESYGELHSWAESRGATVASHNGGYLLKKNLDDFS